MVVVATRLRLRSILFVPMFLFRARQSRVQAERASGCVLVTVRKTQGLTFWTMSAWKTEQNLDVFMSGGPHRSAMPKLYQWCDEAAVVRWMHDVPQPPTWTLCQERLASHGRLSRVRYPSEAQQRGVIQVT